MVKKWPKKALNWPELAKTIGQNNGKKK